MLQKAGKQRKHIEAKPLPTKEVVRFDVTASAAPRTSLMSLVGKPKQYRYLWEHLDPDLKTAIGKSWEPDARLAERPAPAQAPTVEREEAKEAIAEPPKEKRAPRAAIELPEAAAEAPKAAPTTEKRTLRFTKQIYSNLLANSILAAKAVPAIEREARSASERYTVSTKTQLELQRKRPGMAKKTDAELEKLWKGSKALRDETDPRIPRRACAAAATPRQDQGRSRHRGGA